MHGLVGSSLNCEELNELSIAGFDFHGLAGKPKRYNIHVNGPFCLTFEWADGDIYRIDLEDSSGEAYMSEWMITRRPNRKPTHPGEVLREDVLPAMHASVTGFAKSTGMSRQSIHAILACRRAISPEAALRIGAVVGNGARIWLAMQMEFDLWQTEQALHDELTILAA